VSHRRWRIRSVAIVAFAVAAGIAAKAQSHQEVALPNIDTLTCPANTTVTPETPSLHALARLATVEAAPLKGRIVGIGPTQAGRQLPLVIAGKDRNLFSAQVLAAARAACSLRTVADAQRAGYVRSSSYTQGVGVHWTNWRLVDAPFDPRRPSMLLYGVTGGKLRLVGFSYWTRSVRSPVGFAGTGDKWHRHFGLCFDTAGQLESEGLRTPRQCSGTWLNGSDLWMLHAWIVPGNSNSWGLFAPLNSTLCDRYVNDATRCPGVG
jgi:hypothetical protein